jgi:DNA-binding SARP family transcriptional activator
MQSVETALHVRILGALDLRLGEKTLPPLDSARAESLLAYLLLHRDAPQPRQRLAFLLWPDSTEAQARTNLRKVLHTLRGALPDADRFLDVTPRTLQWRPAAPFRLDVADFEDALARDALREAVEAYTGDLLEGSYDDWLLEERERLRDRQLDALDRLSRSEAERGQPAAAIRYAERLLRHDPLREETYRVLMRLHDAGGDRARALRVYHACAATLERELGIEPSSATRELYAELLPGPTPPAPLGGPALVGRAAERARLTGAWEESERGRAQLVLVTGEPGIGKTRLVEELRAWCAHRGALVAEARSYPAEGALAYGPVAAWLRSEALAARRGRLEPGRLAELARVLPELAAGRAPPAPLPEAEQRQRLFDALGRAILAAGAPLLLVADDLHWADRETLQFLHYLLRSAPAAPLLVVATVRREDSERLDELVTALRVAGCLVEVELGRLSRQETAMLADRLAGRRIDEPDAARLFDETEGNPLFVVEALRGGWAGGPAPLSPRVQAVIEARLAQLSEPARALAGVAATIGREFTADVLARAGEADEATLVRGLDELWRRRIVADHGPDAYDFTHDKIREVAYGALGPAERRGAHLRVAAALEETAAHEPGQIAAHYERAGRGERAVPWYERAAAAALALHANVEGIALLERARALVRDPERELALLTAMLAPLSVVDGFASSRLMEVQQRALALRPEPEPPLLRSLAIAALTRADFDDARRAGEQLHKRGERDGDDVLLVEGHYVLGVSAFWQVALAEAQAHFEVAADRYRPEHRATHLVRYGLDPQVVCLSRLANTLGFLGEPGEARRTCARALALADDIRHEPSRATALVFAALLALDLGDEADVRRFTAALGVYGHEVRAAKVTAEVFAGYLDLLDGHAQRGLAAIRHVLEGVSEPGHAPGNRASLVHVLIEACALAGDHRGGLAATEIPLRVRLWEPETLQRRAEFLAALGAPPAEVDAVARASAEARNARETHASASSRRR